MATTEAISAFAMLDDLTTAEDVAHEENVSEWAMCLLEIMNLWGGDRYTFNQLISLSNLSSGRVFLALFLDDRFELDRSKDFYGEIVVNI